MVKQFSLKWSGILKSQQKTQRGDILTHRDLLYVILSTESEKSALSRRNDQNNGLNFHPFSYCDSLFYLVL